MPESFYVTVDVAVPPERAWELVGDPCGVKRWYPLYESCTVEGERRMLRRSDGVELIEHLNDRDDVKMTYSYSVVAGLPLTYHYARFSVQPAPGGCRVVWETAAEHQNPTVDMRARLESRQAEALQGLKRLLETGLPA